MGHAVFWTGLITFLVSLPLMFVFIGFFTLPVGAVMMIAGQFLRKYVNVCVNCKRQF